MHARPPLVIALASFAPVPAAGFDADAANDCPRCADWNALQAPFRIHGDTYYVGTKGLAAILVVSDAGAVLFDGGLPQSAPVIARNIEALGFRVQDVRWILSSHAHFDHAGGIAALQRASGARVGASERGAEALRAGDLPEDDPQHVGDSTQAFPPVAVASAVADGGTIRVGSLAITAHWTPGHAPGGTSWTWRSCEDGDCADVVYADSMTSVSAEGFRFADSAARVAQFKASLAKVAALECDVLLTPHPEASGLLAKADLAGKQARNPFVSEGACERYATAAGERLDARLAQERAAK